MSNQFWFVLTENEQSDPNKDDNLQNRLQFLKQEQGVLKQFSQDRFSFDELVLLGEQCFWTINVELEVVKIFAEKITAAQKVNVNSDQ